MKIEAVETVLWKEGEPLSLVPLHALSTAREPYETLLLQPKALIEATETRIGHVDEGAAYTLCAEFLSLASEQNSDLAVAPEYCVPWTVMEDIRQRRVVPAEGAIWVLGCQSISPDELSKFAAAVNSDQNSFLYHEPFDDRQRQQRAYADPLVYVFWTLAKSGGRVLTFLVQFKTAPCRDKLDVEQRSLYRGQFVYSFNRGLNKIGLISIICSDAFEFDAAIVDEYHANCLLIHIQLNPRPAHVDYATYRAHLCSVGTNSHVELLCLNWAAEVTEVKLNGKQEAWHNVGGSAWYVPKLGFNADDDLVNRAHRLGVYYSVICVHWHAFFFHYEGHILRLQKQKLLVHPAPQATTPKSCLVPLERWTWDSDGGSWKSAPDPKDGFGSVIASYGALHPDLSNDVQADPLAVERALELLVGPVGQPESWFALDEMLAVQVDYEESIRRVTVHQETDETKPGVMFRRSRLQRAQDALTLPGQGVPWPHTLRDLEQGFKFKWSRHAPHHNVSPLHGEKGPAALIYLSEQSDRVAVNRVAQRVTQGLIAFEAKNAQIQGLDMFDAVVRARDRVCVVFRSDHRYCAIGAADRGCLNFCVRGA